MAGRQKNIKVVYQVDTSQVKQATQEVNRAKQATEQLKQSAKQTGEQYRATARDLVGELSILRNKILDTAVTDRKRLDELIPKYRELKAQVDALNKSMDGQAKAVQGVGVSLGGLYGAVRIALTAGLIKETADAVIQMTALAGKIEGVKRAFDKLPNSVLLMEELRQRTHGALTELELMQKALQAKNFGIPIEQLGKLMEFAAIKSQQTGISIQYLTDSIVTGLGRESIKILDNLQIDIGKLKKRMHETGLSMREVVGDIVNEELKKMGGYLETGETKVNQLKAAFSGLGTTISKELEQTGFVGWLTDLVKTYEDFIKGGGTTSGFQLAKDLGEARDEAARFVQQVKDSNKNVEDELKLVKQSREERLKRIEDLKKENAELTEKNKSFIGLQKFNTEEAKRISFNEKIIEALEYKTLVQSYEVKLLGELAKSQKAVDAEQKDNTVTLEKLEKQLEELNEQKKQMNATDIKGIRIKELEIQSVQTLIDRLQRLGRASKEKPFDAKGEIGKFGEGLSGDVDASLKRETDRIKRVGEARLRQIKKNNNDEESEARRSAKARERIERQLTDFAIGAAHNVLTTFNQAQNQQDDAVFKSLDLREKALDAHYNNLSKSTGDNVNARMQVEAKYEADRRKLDAERETLEIQAAQRQKEREKKERLRQIAIDTAAGIVRALTVSPGIGRGGGIAAGIITAEGLIQASVVNKYKKGVIDLKGPGNETSDSIHAMLSKGESVMTAAETRSSMGLLKSIRARKLNDKVFEKLVVNHATEKTDLSPVVKAIERNRPSDGMRQGFFAYEVRQVQRNTTRKIRKAYGF